jgi:hypothetical protein
LAVLVEVKLLLESVSYLFFSRTLHIDTDQVQILVVEDVLLFALLPLLPLAPLALCDAFLFFVFVGDKAFALL